MKKIVSIFVAALFLSPVAAFAAVCASDSGVAIDRVNIGYPYGSNTNGSQYAVQFTPSMDCNITDASFEVAKEGSPAGTFFASIYTDSGGVPGVLISTGSSISASSLLTWPLTSVVSSSFSSGALLNGTAYWLVLKSNDPSDSGNYVDWSLIDTSGGTSAYNFSGSWTGITQRYVFEIDGSSGPPPPPPPPSSTTLAAAVANATSSFQQTFGFSMDGVSNWMWDNLGQPILGSGLGTLVVLKWQILSLIAMSIIIFFCFAYFRFFKQ